jgi:hypothetical protein
MLTASKQASLSEAFFLGRSGLKYRKCEVCKHEYRPQRKAQSYCSPRCRRSAAYGRERFRNETRGRRKRCLRPREASDSRTVLSGIHPPETLSGGVVPGSFRKHDFSPMNTVPSSGVFPCPIDILGGRGQGRGLLDRKTRETILCCEVGAPSCMPCIRFCTASTGRGVRLPSGES